MKKGFTLLELLIVIAIIGILATIITLNVANAKDSAKKAKAISDLDTIAKMEEYYKSQNTTQKYTISRSEYSCDIYLPVEELSTISLYRKTNGWFGVYRKNADLF